MLASHKERELLNRTKLTDYLADHSKPEEQLSLGIEYERISIDRRDCRICTSEEVITALAELTSLDWEARTSYRQVYCYKKHDVSITCEPGGQLEISLPPLTSAQSILELLSRVDSEVNHIFSAKGWELLALGANPLGERRTSQIIPRTRHQIMNSHMRNYSSCTDYAMLGTASVQISVNYANEIDMRNKYRVGSAGLISLMPLFSSSPIINNQATAATSNRYFLWIFNDQSRCSLMPGMFNEQAGFSDYVDYMLAVPMLFTYEEEKILASNGADFTKFMRGQLTTPNRFANFHDWSVHLGTAFPPIRLLPNRIELRSCDSLPKQLVAAICAFWRGLLSDPATLKDAAELIRDWRAFDFQFNFNTAAQTFCLLDNPRLKKLTTDYVNLAKCGLAKLPNSEKDMKHFELVEERLAIGENLAFDLIKLYSQLGYKTDKYLETVMQNSKLIF